MYHRIYPLTKQSVKYIVFRNFTKVATTAPFTGYFQAGLGKSVLKSALGAAVAMGALTAGQAQALGVRVNLNGQDYNITTFTGSYNDNITKFKLPAAGGVMPWWFNETLAAQFAIAVDAQLGTPNILDGLSGPPAGTGAGPFFGYVTNGPDNIMYGYGWVSNYGVGQGVIGFPSGATSRSWAQVTAVPGPLPVLGAVAAFGFSRKLRKRLQNSGNSASRTHTL